MHYTLGGNAIKGKGQGICSESIERNIKHTKKWDYQKMKGGKKTSLYPCLSLSQLPRDNRGGGTMTQTPGMRSLFSSRSWVSFSVPSLLLLWWNPIHAVSDPSGSSHQNLDDISRHVVSLCSLMHNGLSEEVTCTAMQHTFSLILR